MTRLVISLIKTHPSLHKAKSWWALGLIWVVGYWFLFLSISLMVVFYTITGNVLITGLQGGGRAKLIQITWSVPRFDDSSTAHHSLIFAWVLRHGHFRSHARTHTHNHSALVTKWNIDVKHDFPWLNFAETDVSLDLIGLYARIVWSREGKMPCAYVSAKIKNTMWCDVSFVIQLGRMLVGVFPSKFESVQVSHTY